MALHIVAAGKSVSKSKNGRSLRQSARIATSLDLLESFLYLEWYPWGLIPFSKGQERIAIEHAEW